jgi:5-(carboxyamino)imidazole ribonucleotide synthase
MPDAGMRPDPLPPGSTIGILGGGQLGRMLAMAAAKLGLRTHIYSDEADCPAFDVAALRMVGEFEDLDRLQSRSSSSPGLACRWPPSPRSTRRPILPALWPGSAAPAS